MSTEFDMNGAASAEPLAAPAPAIGTGTSTGTTALTVSAVTGHIWVPSTVTGTGVPANTTIIAGPSAGGAGTYTTNQNTTLAAIALTFTPLSTTPVFPDFVPPSPPVAAGNPPPPAFPPPSIPPPAGPLGGPLFTSTGTSNTAATGPNVVTFPGFSVTLLNPPITVSNIITIPTYSAGPPPKWTSTLPAYIVTTPPMPHMADAPIAAAASFSFNGDEPPPRSLSAAATKRGRAHARNLHHRHP